MKWVVREILSATGGRLLKGDAAAVIEHFSTDTRTLKAGELFAAIPGDTFDGHAFLAQAGEIGAAGALICRDVDECATAKLPLVIRVGDTTEALAQLAATVRTKMDIPIVGIVGSNGKTTTKELTAAVTGEGTLKSEASFNNVWGVSRTLLRYDPDKHSVAVLEIGTNHFGEIAALVKLTRPTIGVFTNVGTDHTEFLVDEEGIARENGELVLTTEQAILNADDPRVIAFAPRCQNVLTFGRRTDAAVRAENVLMNPDGCPVFDLWIHRKFVGRPTLPTLGVHNVSNALAAASVGVVLDIAPSNIVSRLETATPPKMRMERKEWNGVTIYNDAYNANPNSVRAAMAFLRDVRVEGRRFFVLGEMLELGEKSPQYHQEVAAALSPSICDVFLPLGKYADLMAKAAKDAGVPVILRCATPQDAARTLAGLLHPGDAALLKASRGIRLEAVFMALAEPKN